MVRPIYYFPVILLALILTFLGCAKDVDFDQVNDFEVSPILESSLVYLDASVPEFLDGGVERSMIQDFLIIDVFKGGFINNNLIKAEFLIGSTNSINRSFELKIDFLNGSDQVQHSFTVPIPASSANAEVVSQHTEVFEDQSLAALKQTSKLVFTLTLLPGSPLNGNTPGKIHLKSKIVSYFNYKK